MFLMHLNLNILFAIFFHKYCHFKTCGITETETAGGVKGLLCSSDTSCWFSPGDRIFFCRFSGLPPFIKIDIHVHEEDLVENHLWKKWLSAIKS